MENVLKKQNRKRHSRFESSRIAWGIVFILPAAVLCLAFVVYPLINVFIYSFHEWNGVSQNMAYVGFNNYSQLPSSEGFWAMALATLLFALGSTILVILIAFMTALILDNKGRGRINRGFMRSLWFFPCILSGSVVGIVWRIMYNYSNGVINSIIKSAGLAPVNWLETYGLTNFSIIIAATWVQVGLCIVVFLAGLQSIPLELGEAASIDGASNWQVRRFITIPMMAPAITINVIATSIASFKMYELPWLVSKGLPGYSTRLLTQRIYFFAFQSGKFGIGSALAVLLILIITAISLVQLVLLRKWEEIY